VSTAASEEQLVAAARTVLGDGVLAAGIFGLQDLVYAQAAGVVAGGTVGGFVGPSPGADALGAAVGGRLAVEAAAAALGVTPALLVAVTDDTVHVCNWNADDTAGDEVARFDRSTVHVTVRKFGLSRIVTLDEPSTGASFNLHATAAPFLKQAKADAVVLALLATD
jgi:hypothetical protein